MMHGRAGRRLGLLAISLLLTLGVRVASAQTVRTIIGQGNPDGLPATAIPINAWHMVVGPNGDLFVLEVGSSLPGGGSYIFPRLLRITPDGMVARVAGTGNSGDPQQGAKAIEAPFNLPRGVAVDARGNIYVADQRGNRVSMIDASGVITTFAGTGTAGNSGDGGKAAEAQLSAPRGVAVDPTDGTVYIADTGNALIRRVAPDGIISTFAGTGAVDFNVAEGKATEVNLGSPRGILVDRQGNVYVAEFATHRVRKITRDGVLTTVAGNGDKGVAGDGGKATAAAIEAPLGLALDANGNLYISQQLANVVRKVDASGTITTVAGNGTAGYAGDGGKATEAELNTPNSLAVDASGQLLIGDVANNRIRRVNADGTITTVAGGAGANGLKAEQVSVVIPRGGVRDAQGNFYVADIGHNRVLKIDPNGIVTLLAGNGAPGYRGSGIKAADAGFGTVTDGVHIDGVAVDGQGNVFIPDTYGHRVHKVSPDGMLVTIAGTGEAGYSGDGGKATEAQVGDIWNVVADAQGNLYVADGTNRRVRKIDPSGIVTTYAGNGSENFSGEGGPAVDAGIPGPDGVSLGPDGSLYIADTTDTRVRKVTPDGKIITVAGNGEKGYSGDGGKATDANLSEFIENVAVDSKGNLYMADGENNVIRVVTPDGIINTFAGTTSEGFNGDGKPLKETNISEARDLYVDAQGNIIFAENDNSSRVRIILINP
jgi:sugar lactone lactonase YvrE